MPPSTCLEVTAFRPIAGLVAPGQRHDAWSWSCLWSRAAKAGWLTRDCLHTCPTQLLVSILGQMGRFCSRRWVLLWEPRTTGSLRQAHHALKHTPVLIFRWLGKASRQKRYIIYSALRSRQSQGSTARAGRAARTPRSLIITLPVSRSPPAQCPWKASPRMLWGTARISPAGDQDKLFSHLQRSSPGRSS